MRCCLAWPHDPLAAIDIAYVRPGAALPHAVPAATTDWDSRTAPPIVPAVMASMMVEQNATEVQRHQCCTGPSHQPIVRTNCGALEQRVHFGLSCADGATDDFTFDRIHARIGA